MIIIKIFARSERLFGIETRNMLSERKGKMEWVVKLTTLVAVAGMVACGGEMDSEIGQVNQAVEENDSGATPPSYVVTLWSYQHGVIGTGMLVGPNKILINKFHHYLQFPHWQNKIGFYRPSNGRSQSIWMLNNGIGPDCQELFGVWAICQFPGAPESGYYSNWTYSWPSGKLTVSGAGRTCTSGSQSTNYQNWVFEPYANRTLPLRAGSVYAQSGTVGKNTCTAAGFQE